MIFVTVGTHEQQFNRLIKCVDELKGSGVVTEDVIIQSGFSTFEPKNSKWIKFLPYNEMHEYVAEARIVITHGGPASFIMPIHMGKIPIVVPRSFEFGEHVNNHQIEFAKAIEERMKNIIPVYDIQNLEKILVEYDVIVSKIPKESTSNNMRFIFNFEKIVEGMFS